VRAGPVRRVSFRPCPSPRGPALALVADRFFKFLELLLVLCLASMVIMVFGNVVLRYAFDSGINVSEELSRYVFVWLTFIGAVVVARDNAHMGVETLVARFGPAGRKVCMGLCDAMVLGCCMVFFWGTWKQAPLNMSNTAPITGISMIWIYGIGFFTSVGIGVMTLQRLLRLLTGRLGPNELAAFAGQMEHDAAHVLKGRLE
jgi:TRAP-type C4-dicarboxylate transport system permease small subunit